MVHLAVLAVFAGLALNPLLQFALGAAGTAGDAFFPKTEARRELPLFQMGILLLSTLFLWAFFAYLFPLQWMGFCAYFLFFPLSALLCMGFEFLGGRFFPRLGSARKTFSAFTAYDGLVPAALFISSALAANFAEAAVLVLFFVVGNLAAALALNEIRRRSALEWVPHCLRGSPLTLISMGLLALISGAAAGICFKMLEAF